MWINLYPKVKRKWPSNQPVAVGSPVEKVGHKSKICLLWLSVSLLFNFSWQQHLLMLSEKLVLVLLRITIFLVFCLGSLFHYYQNKVMTWFVICTAYCTDAYNRFVHSLWLLLCTGNYVGDGWLPLQQLQVARCGWGERRKSCGRGTTPTSFGICSMIYCLLAYLCARVGLICAFSFTVNCTGTCRILTEFFGF